jgi:hypothetical protein
MRSGSCVISSAETFAIFAIPGVGVMIGFAFRREESFTMGAQRRRAPARGGFDCNELWQQAADRFDVAHPGPMSTTSVFSADSTIAARLLSRAVGEPMDEQLRHAVATDIAAPRCRDAHLPRAGSKRRGAREDRRAGHFDRSSDDQNSTARLLASFSGRLRQWPPPQERVTEDARLIGR